MTDPSAALPADAELPPVDLPPAPRPVTPRGRRRAWAELPVRVWIVLSIVMLLVIAYFAGTRVVAAQGERTLIASGTLVEAEVMELSGEGVRGQQFDRTRADLRARVRFPWGPDKALRESSGDIAPATEGVIAVGMKIPLRVDPADPDRWTDRTAPKAWTHELAAAGLLLPLLAGSAAMALLRRGQALASWRRGEPVHAVVVDSRSSAVAPGQRVVRYSAIEGEDRRVYSMLYPTRAGVPEPGTAMLLVAPRRRLDLAVVAALYA